MDVRRCGLVMGGGHAARRVVVETANEGAGRPRADRVLVIEKGGMKVFLDDVRDTPEGWVRVYWPEEACRLLETGQVTEISLDHDLGDDLRGTGYDVVKWIEEAVFTRGFRPPRITVHSANGAARARMEAGIWAIEALIEARELPSAGSRRGPD